MHRLEALRRVKVHGPHNRAADSLRDFRAQHGWGSEHEWALARVRVRHKLVEGHAERVDIGQGARTVALVLLRGRVADVPILSVSACFDRSKCRAVPKSIT